MTESKKVVGTFSKPMKVEQIIDETNCPVRTTMSIIGSKWKPVVLYYIKIEGVCRFGELQRYIPHITKKMLTQQLRELESDGIVKRKVLSTSPSQG